MSPFMRAFKVVVFVALMLCSLTVAYAAATAYGPLMVAPAFMLGVFAGYGWASWADS